MKVAIVDFGSGNLRSVAKAIEHLSAKTAVAVTRESFQIKQADRVILPGQGAIGQWMQEMQDPGLSEAVRNAIRNQPVLGICLGLQALYRGSEENNGTRGIGVLAGRVKRFNSSNRQFKVPHMGWNTVEQKRPHPLWRGIRDGERFYFVHSYYATDAADAEIAGTSNYQVEFVAAAARENLFAVQFHPEKSQHAGLELLHNFLAWDGGV